MYRGIEIKKRLPLITICLTILLIAIHGVVFSSPTSGSILSDYGVKPSEVLKGHGLYTIFTSMFLHVGTMHILGNILTLIIFGYILENGIGARKFLILYLGAGLAGSFLFIGANPSSTESAIGASGAIAGVMGACLIGYPGEKAPLVYLLTLVFPIFMTLLPPLIATVLFFTALLPSLVLFISKTAPIFPFILIWIVYQIYRGSSAIGAETGVAYWAHIGGLVGGIILYLILSREPTPDEPEWESVPATTPQYY